MAVSGAKGDRLSSDAELVASARRGDRSAFASLVERHRPLALALAGELLGDRHVAADVVQEAAVTALVGLDRLRTPGKFGPWFCGVALNLARRWWRDARRAGAVQLVTTALADGPEELALRADLAERVRAAVEALPVGQRDAVLAFYWKGLSQSEAAEELGVTPGAVKARLHQARANLAPLLANLVTRQDMTEIDTTAHGSPTRRKAPMPDEPARSGDEWVPVHVDQVVRSRDPATSLEFHAVVLRDHDGTRRVPIYIGNAEATALAFSLETVETPRPMTYAMAAQLVEVAGGTIDAVRITRLSDRTVYAAVVVETPSGSQEVDARPSDALNLALVTESPILVESAVFDALESCALEDWRRYPDRASQLVAEAQGLQARLMEAAAAAMDRQEPRPLRADATEPPI